MWNDEEIRIRIKSRCTHSNHSLKNQIAKSNQSHSRQYLPQPPHWNTRNYSTAIDRMERQKCTYLNRVRCTGREMKISCLSCCDACQRWLMYRRRINHRQNIRQLFIRAARPSMVWRMLVIICVLDVYLVKKIVACLRARANNRK